MSELQARVDSEKDSISPRPRFVVDDTETSSSSEAHFRPALPAEPDAFANDHNLDRKEVQRELLPDTGESSWRSEVSERLHRYHARRRPRAPRYPSLRLKFETPDRNGAPAAPSPDITASSPPATAPASVTSPAASASPAESVPEPRPEPPAPKVAEATVPVVEHSGKPNSQETTAKIIEFPRYAPPSSMNDLAESIMDRPRIVEVPEVVPPPPALGGILIEESRERPVERQLGIDMPLQSVDLDQRILAAAIDTAIVLVAAVGFVAIFYRFSDVRPALSFAAGFSAGLIALLWMGYQYLLIVYSSTTPGLRAMRLKLQRFDGRVPDRRIRRWRVLGSFLSAITLGMGYAWLFLDEDRLCWHERVTKTYLAREEQQ